jgi:DNA-sulfur modification-associated
MPLMKLFRGDRPKPSENYDPDGATTYIPAIPLGGQGFVTAMSQKEISQFTYRPAMIYDKRVQRLGLEEVEELLRMLREIQRPVAGAKARNIDRYAEYQVGLARGEHWGLVPPRILWSPEEIKFVRMHGQTMASIPAGTRAYILDGETGKAAADEARKTEAKVDEIDVAVIWMFGLPRDFASQAHHDLNLFGVRPTIPVALNLDRRDPITDVAKKIARNGILGGRIVMDKRQVSEADAVAGKVMTLASLRGFVMGLALGKSAIGRATAPVRRDEAPDPAHLKLVAGLYAKKIAEHSTLSKQLTDRESMLSVGAVQVVLGSLAHDLVADDKLPEKEVNDRLDKVVTDLAKVKWERGTRWNGIGGKINPTTQKFSVGGSKEYGYAIHRALTDKSDAAYKQVRA